MIRRIYCRQCGEPHQLDSRDSAAGWIMRKTTMSLKLPPGLKITITAGSQTKEYPQEALHCDACGRDITGSIGVAVTEWRPNKEPYPRDWEGDYGTALSPQAVAAYDRLAEEKGAQ